jgi:hypothetical protein
LAVLRPGLIVRPLLDPAKRVGRAQVVEGQFLGREVGPDSKELVQRHADTNRLALSFTVDSSTRSHVRRARSRCTTCTTRASRSARCQRWSSMASWPTAAPGADSTKPRCARPASVSRQREAPASRARRARRACRARRARRAVHVGSREKVGTVSDRSYLEGPPRSAARLELRRHVADPFRVVAMDKCSPRRSNTCIAPSRAIGDQRFAAG